MVEPGTGLPDPHLLECWVLLGLLREVITIPVLEAGAGLSWALLSQRSCGPEQGPTYQTPLFGSSCYSFSPINPFSVP